MDMALFLLFIIAILFATAYLTKRRFGVLGLALCAGSLLSTMWTGEVTPLIQDAGLRLLTPPLGTVVAVVLVLLPAVLLLFNGPTYKRLWQRIIGAAAFALLATSFLLVPLGTGLVLDDTTQEYYNFLVDNRNIIITAAIAYAIFDIVTYKPPKLKDKK